MKRCLLALMSVLLLGLAGCAPAPKYQVPTVSTSTQTYDLVYDMQRYDFFSDIFAEKALDQWNSMGRYTMLLEGLDTPVVVDMDGTDVLSISAYDQTVELGTEGLATDYDDGLSPVYYIGSTQDAVVIRVSGGEALDSSILITEARVFQQEVNTNFYIRDDGTLEYFQTWNDPINFEQMGYDALECYTSRDELLYETGRAEIVDDELVLTPERTVVLSDQFDLDALFAEAKAAGKYEEYETLDDLLAANEHLLN